MDRNRPPNELLRHEGREILGMALRQCFEGKSRSGGWPFDGCPPLRSKRPHARVAACGMRREQPRPGFFHFFFPAPNEIK